MIPETQTQWEARMGMEIIDYLKSEIYLDLPFMELALSALIPEGNEELTTYATDGITLYFGPEHLIQVFKNNERFLERAYLHTVLHCIYAHLWIAGERDRSIWNVACDIAVEYVIDHMNKPCTKRILSWQRQQIYQRLEEQHLVSAAGIYEFLLTICRGEDGTEKDGTEENKDTKKQQVDRTEKWSLQALGQEFHTDDHRYWPAPEKDQRKKSPQESKPKQNWQKIARQMQLKKDQKGNDPEEGEQMMFSQIQANKGRRSYGDFLKKFAVRREELHLNMEEFDLSYYTYGLEKYGNIPLIEPLETSEEKKIKELVIVVDTSYSTSGDLVEGFLQETFTILKQKEAFFQQNKIHVIQCDDEVREDIEITSERQMEQLIANFQIQGGGNTDFRPAFTYVQELRNSGKLKNPGGLLYFTDGNGIYPKKKPDFKTAFLFLGEYERDKVPAWAMQLELEKEELRHASKSKNVEAKL